MHLGLPSQTNLLGRSYGNLVGQLRSEPSSVLPKQAAQQYTLAVIQQLRVPSALFMTMFVKAQLIERAVWLCRNRIDNRFPFDHLL